MKGMLRWLAIPLGIAEVAMSALMFFGVLGEGRVLNAIIFLLLGVMFLSYGLYGRPTLDRLTFGEKDKARKEHSGSSD